MSIQTVTTDAVSTDLAASYAALERSSFFTGTVREISSRYLKIKNVVDNHLAAFRQTFSVIDQIDPKKGTYRGAVFKNGKLVTQTDGRGYVLVCFKGARLRGQEVQFILHTGRQQARNMVLDHVDGDPANNSIKNIAEVFSADNGVKANPRARDVNAPRGVEERSIAKRKGGYKAAVSVAYFATKEDAVAATSAIFDALSRRGFTRADCLCPAPNIAKTRGNEQRPWQLRLWSRVLPLDEARSIRDELKRIRYGYLCRVD